MSNTTIEYNENIAVNVQIGKYIATSLLAKAQ